MKLTFKTDQSGTYHPQFRSVFLIFKLTMTEKDESVIFDEKYLISLENKMINKRTEADLLKELQKRAESEFKKIQTEYIKADKVIKQNAIIQTD